MSPRAKGFVPWCAVAAGTALPMALVLASGRTLAWRDTARLFGPLRAPIVVALRELRLPLWNPHEALGVPLFAQMMHGVLHPVSLAAAFLAPGAGLDALVVAHVLLAALGAAFLARQLGASPAASAVAGFGYGLSGFVLGMSAIVQYLGAAGTAPWAVAALRVAGKRGRLAVPVAALAIAALVFAGDPQWAAVAAALGAALALEAGGGRGLARAFVALALGALLAAVQLAPTWAYFRETVRSAGLTSEDRMQWALSPWRILELVAPGFFGGRPGPAAAPVFLLLGGPTQYPLPFAPSVFVGAPVVALAVAGARASRSARVLAGAALALLWLALGAWLGADQVLRHAPVWGSFRYAEKLVGPLALCLAVLASLGADRIAAGLRPRPALAAAGAVAMGAAGVALALWPAEGDAALALERLGIGLAHASVALGLLAAGLAVAARPAARLHFPAIAAGLVFLASAAASSFALHAGTRGAREERPLTAIREPGAVTRIAVPLDSVVNLGHPELDEWDRMIALQSHMGEPPFNVPAGIDEVRTYTGLVPRRFGAVDEGLRRDFGAESWVAWRRFGLTHVVVDQVASVDPGQWRVAETARAGGSPVLRDPDWGFTVWRVPGRPWASFAEGAVSASGEEAYARLVEMLVSGRPDVVVEGPAPPRLASGRILSAWRGTERIRIEAEASGDALLVVNDAFWPGWEATVDGRPVPILPADALVRAIPFPAGVHSLEMRYDPPELRAGLAASGVGLVPLALLIAAARRRKGAASASPLPP